MDNYFERLLAFIYSISIMFSLLFQLFIHDF